MSTDIRASASLVIAGLAARVKLRLIEFITLIEVMKILRISLDKLAQTFGGKRVRT